MKRLFFLLLFLVPGFAHAAVAFDTSVVGASGVATSPAYYTITLAGTDTAICVGNQGAVSGTDATTNVQIGTAAGTSTATKLGGAQTPSDRYGDLWCLLTPPTGTVTVRVDFTGTFLSSVASAYSGVSTIDAAVITTTATSLTYGIATTPLQAGAWVLAEAINQNRVPTAGSGTTVRSSISTGIAIADNNLAISPPTSTTLNFIAALSGTWSGVIVALEPPVIPPTPAPAGIGIIMNGVKTIINNAKMLIQ